MNAQKFWTKAITWWRREVRPFLLLALVLFSIRSSFADWNDVPTGSMQPSILVGDRIFVNKLAYDFKVPFTTWHITEWGQPSRGDIVVFYSPHDGQRLVKRVIGLPGDTVALRDNRLYLNGLEVKQETIGAGTTAGDQAGSARLYLEFLPGQTHSIALIPGTMATRTFGPYRVPEDHFFMMGDNRDDSFDSRYFGPVKRNQILGRANAVVFSLDRKNYWLPRSDRFVQAL